MGKKPVVAKPSTSAKVEPGVGQGPIGGLAVHGVLGQMREMRVVRRRHPGDDGPSAPGAAVIDVPAPAGAAGAEAGERQLGSHVLPHHLDGHAHGHLLGFDVDQVRDHACPVGAVEVDGDHDVGELVRQRRDEGLAHDRVGVHRPGARQRRTTPTAVLRQTRAHRPRGMARLAARRAALHHQAVLGGRLPPPHRLGVGGGHRHLVGEPALGHRPSRRHAGALVGTPAALVTRQVSAPSTWQVDSPRSWRTPSTTWLSPWM